MQPRQSILSRWWSLFCVGGVVLLVTVLRPYKSHPPIDSDGIGHHLWTRALLQGDLSFRRYVGQPGISPAHRPGYYRNCYPPGVSLLRLPVMAFLVDTTSDAPLISTAEHWANLFCGGAALLGICWLCLQTLRLLQVSEMAAHLAVCCVVFGTGLFHYGTYDACYSHIYSALVGALLLWLGVRTIQLGRPTLPVLAVAPLCVLAVLLRNTNILLLGGLALAYFAARCRLGSWSWRDVVTVGLGIAVGVSIQLAYNSYTFGRPTLSSYGGGFNPERPMQLAVLFSYERGVFLYYPIAALALVLGLCVRRARPWVVGFAGVLLAYVTLYGFWDCWTLGGSFGYRGLVEVMPAAGVVLGLALGGLSGLGRRCATVAALLCVLVTLELLVGSWAWHLGGESGMRSAYWRHVCGQRSVLRILY